MLKLVKINKIYKAANNEVKALNDVSLNFRQSEFVSILGPSGSGKTTLLNIIGGLDKYSSGDLIIAGKSTKNYKDRDWDYYRSERIGFIFQSYNLIPHQNVLSNVELALTITGINKEERIRRAKEALDKVGLTDQYYKKPNQLSGGQCQRVAIARALVNNPEILLADEPTGALDTKTSRQIMDLIKEISKDRLVIMVTHNPELAEQYSSRIIRLLDGEVIEDSNPFLNEDEDEEIASLDEETLKKKSKAKMGLLTSTFLSFKNLVSKKGRTILVSIASSIGIIGVSTVLSVSFGVTNYVQSMQDDMLSSYPLQIAEQSLDLNSLITGLSSQEKANITNFDIHTQVGMNSFIEYLMDKYRDFTSFSTNDINKDVIEYISSIPEEDVATISYDYGMDISNNIFTNWVPSVELENGSDTNKLTISTNGLTQRYIKELEKVEGFSEYARYVNLFTNFMKQLPDDREYILNQYDQLGNSNLSLEDNSLTLVIDSDSTLTDILLAQLGIYDHDEFINIGQKAVEIYKRGDDNDQSTWGWKRKLNEGVITQQEYDEAMIKLSEDFPYTPAYNYDELLNREFYYIPHSLMWDYGNVSNDTKMEGSFIFYDANKLYSLNYDNTYADYGFDVLKGTEIDFNSSSSKEVYFARQASSIRDGETFYNADKSMNGGWLEINVPAGSSLIEVFIEAAAKSELPLTGRGLAVDNSIPSEEIFTFIPFIPSSVSVVESYSTPVTPAQVTDTINGYYYPAVINTNLVNDPNVVKLKIGAILRAKETTNFGCLSRGVYYTKALADRFMNDANKEESKIINEVGRGFKAFFESGKAITENFGAYVKFSYVDSSDTDNPVLKTDGYASAFNSGGGSMMNMFSGIIGGTSSLDTNINNLRLITGLKVDYDTDTYKASYELLPSSIAIYPKDFNSKDKVTSYLNKWNVDGDIELNGRIITRDERTDISYTDTVSIIINVINSLITIVTSALVAFTSLSLVVSCFMIAVITYISVMERVKEIGVIRSLGGRKRDVSRLFIAENFMTGLASGLIGVGVSYLLSIIINVVVHFFGAPNIALLPWWMALIMVMLAISLNVISGLIPSTSAAKQDPVNALRSE